MPILTKIQKPDLGGKRTYQSKKDNPNNRAVYNTQTWRKLRLLFLSENPLCKRCLNRGIITSAVEVHHILPIDEGNTIMEKKTLGYNWDNLEGLCKDCHTEHHRTIRRMKNRNYDKDR